MGIIILSLWQNSTHTNETLHQNFLDCCSRAWGTKIPIRGTERLNLSPRTAWPCKLSSGNHTASTNSLAEDQNQGRRQPQVLMLCNNKCFYGDFPAPLRGRQKCCFFPALSKLWTEPGGAGSSPVSPEMEQPWGHIGVSEGESLVWTPCTTPQNQSW